MEPRLRANISAHNRACIWQNDRPRSRMCMYLAQPDTQKVPRAKIKTLGRFISAVCDLRRPRSAICFVFLFRVLLIASTCPPILYVYVCRQRLAKGIKSNKTRVAIWYARVRASSHLPRRRHFRIITATANNKNAIHSARTRFCDIWKIARIIQKSQTRKKRAGDQCLSACRRAGHTRKAVTKN